MKKQLKVVFTVLVLSVTASTSFATDPVVSMLPVVDLADSSADLATYHDMAIAEMNLGFATSSTPENVAYVGQSGDNNIAYVSQTGTGNFAVITQVNATDGGVANVAYVSQSGNTNRAVINQR
jgi:hypothetical protein